MIERKLRRNFKNEVNPSSMADVAFLLLIFFLVSTTINIDRGILVRLPPWSEISDPAKISDRNLCRILVNKNDQLFVRNKEIELDMLSSYIVDFINNPNSNPKLAKSPIKAVVSLQNDRATSYTAYLDVYNEIKTAYRLLRDEKAQLIYGIPFEACNSIQQKQIASAIPLNISESEPSDYSIE